MASAIQRQDWRIAGPRITAAIAGGNIPGQYRHSFRRGMLGKFVQIKAMMAAVRVNTARLALAVPQIRGQLNRIRGQGEQNPDQVDQIADQVDQITDQSDRISVGRDYVEYLVSRVEGHMPSQDCPIGKAGLLPLARWVRNTLHRRAVAVVVPAGPPAALESSGITRSITDGDGGKNKIHYPTPALLNPHWPLTFNRQPRRKMLGIGLHESWLFRDEISHYLFQINLDFLHEDDPRWLSAMIALAKSPDMLGGAVNG